MVIKSLHIKSFKGFKDYSVAFDRVNLLVGGNNSGKTTIFHALQTVFWCIQQTADVGQDGVTFRKTQVPEVGAIPYFNQRDLFHKQRTRQGRLPSRICLRLETDVTPPIEFSIYPAFSRNLMVDGGNSTISAEQYDSLLNLNPVYIPGMIGITVKEELYRVVAQERLIAEGRQNQVIRNLVYRLKAKDTGGGDPDWSAFVGAINPLFHLHGIAVPFDDRKDEWLTATYREGECEFDLVSAGSGFLQVINLLSFLFLHTSKVSLLDEPDSHMHDDLQRLTFDLLDQLSMKRNIQLIIATHSPTLIDAAGLSNVLIIDREFSEPLRAKNVDTLVPLLGDRGLTLPPAKVINTLKSRKAIFVEGAEADFVDFLERLGEVYRPGFRALTRGLTVFQTHGATAKWPFDAIKCFQDLMGQPLDYVYLSDRDFLTDEEITEREKKAQKCGYAIHHLQRRNRESYLLEPAILSRTLVRKWERTHRNEQAPELLSEAGLAAYMLREAVRTQEDVRTTFLVQQEPRLRGDATHRMEMTGKVNQYFRDAYSDPAAAGRIPYKLFDSELCLRKLRGEIAENYHLSFADREVWESYVSSEIPEEVTVILDKLLKMFPPTSWPCVEPASAEGEPTLWSDK
jgi:hypothetical protein